MAQSDGLTSDGQDETVMEEASQGPATLKDELADLIEDGKTYAEAELAYQKTRLSFAADRGKMVLILGVLALGFVHLALIALVVGAVIALSSQVGGWAATGIVVGVLFAATAILGLIIRANIKGVIAAFAKPHKSKPINP